MSKLLKQYNELKKQNSELIYIFRVGIFYNIFNEDAKILNEKFGLKLTSLSSEIIKCGFPISSLEKYTKKFNDLGLNYNIIDNLPQNTNIVDYSNNMKLNQLLKNISEIDMNNTTFQQSFNILLNIQENLKNVYK